MLHAAKQNKPQKLSQIVDTAKYLFLRHGIRRVTVEEICKKANVSKMSFYKHFKNKIDLLKYLWRDWLDEGYAVTDEINARNIPFTEKLELMIKWKMEFLSEMSSEFIEETVHADPEMMGFMMEFKQRSYRRFMDYFLEWQKNGDIRSDIRPELFLAVVDKIRDIFDDDNIRNLYTDTASFSLELNKLFFYGIVNGQEPGK